MQYNNVTIVTLYTHNSNKRRNKIKRNEKNNTTVRKITGYDYNIILLKQTTTTTTILFY